MACIDANPRRLRAGPALAAAVLLAGCANTVVVPPPSGERASAFLLDHGQHASLVLPGERGPVRYTYGEWGYYVAGRKGLWNASGTLFGTNEAGIGRRPLEAPGTLAGVRRAARVRIEHAWRIEVAAPRARRLRRRLDRLFADDERRRSYNARYDLTFVAHPRPYHLCNNSNHMTGRWLSQLGCRVHMATPFSVWSVRYEAAADGDGR